MTTQDKEPEKSPVSEKQRRANAKNAQHSSGPKSAAGKERSAQNSVRHGAYARELHPLQTGPFAEEPQAFVERAEAIIESLAPRNAVEADICKRIADLMM